MRWVWAAAAALLWQQLTLLGGVRARREPKRPRKPGQHPAAPNATTSSSEGLLGFPKLPEASGPEFTDAHMTWLNFVRRPDDGASKKRCRGQDKKSAGQYTSVFVDNGSGAALTVQSGSSFSGLLLGT
eukprot:bmy_10020T0